MTVGEGHHAARKHERLALRIPVRVRVRDGADPEWSELSSAENVARGGMSFVLTRGIPVGRLVHLSLPLPWRLRQFDPFEDLYKVWGLTRWVAPHGGSHRIGIAFVGRNPPASYLHDPAHVYGAAAARPVGEKPPQRSAPEAPRFVEKRRESRIGAALPVDLEAIDARGNARGREATVTRSVSRCGAACYTSLEAGVGSFVRVIAHETTFTATALVRARRSDAGSAPTIHLEFIGAQWPLDIGPAEL